MADTQRHTIATRKNTQGTIDLVALASFCLLGSFWFFGVTPFILQLFSMSFWKSFATIYFLISDVLLVAGGLLFLRNKKDIFVIVSFVAVTYFPSHYINHLSLIFYLNGMRYYAALLFVVPILRYILNAERGRERFIAIMDKNLYIFLIVQAPCLVYQLVRFGGWDYGGGSFGVMNSGVVSSIIYMISYYLVLKNWDPAKSYLGNLKANWVKVFLLFPTFLNETKISLIFLLLYFLFLIPTNRNFFKNLSFSLVLLGTALGLAVTIYETAIKAEGGEAYDITDMQSMVQYTAGHEVLFDLMETYIEQEQDDMMTGDYARGIKLYATSLIFENYPDAIWFGFGLGQARSAKHMEATKFQKKFDFLTNQGTFIFVMNYMLETGVAGMAWFIMWLVLYFRPYRKLGAKRNKMLSAWMVIYIILECFYMHPFMATSFAIFIVYQVFICTRWDLVQESRRFEELKVCNKEGVTTVK